MILIGFDPGESNFGVSVVEINGYTIDLVSIGMNSITITNLTETPQKLPKSKQRKKNKNERIPPYLAQVKQFSIFVKRLLNRHDIAGICSERYMTRGIKGKSVECVSTMNGITSYLAVSKNIPMIILPAAVWKNRVNKYVDLKELYIKLKSAYKPHEIDSAFIALHMYIKINSLEKDDNKCKKLILKMVKALMGFKNV